MQKLIKSPVIKRDSLPIYEALPCDSDSDPCLGGDADVVDGQLVFVNVMILLEDVVQVPDLDAPVQAGGDDAVVPAGGQRDDV